MTSLQCVEAFSPTTMCFGGEQNREKYGSQSEQYLHSWGGVVTLDPPTKEEPSTTRHRTQHSGAFANLGTPQSLVLISSPTTLITPTTTMIMLISYKLVFIITLIGYQKSVSFFVVTTRLISFLSIQFSLLLI